MHISFKLAILLFQALSVAVNMLFCPHILLIFAPLGNFVTLLPLARACCASLSHRNDSLPSNLSSV